MRKTLLGLLFAMMALPATAREIAGVPLADTLQLGEPPQSLRLNGAGVRKKFFVKIYVGALYLPTPSREAAVVLAMPGPKSVHMHFLYDEVSAEKLRDAWSDGFRANQSAAQYKELAPRLAQFNSAFPAVRRGDVIRLDMVPGTGTVVWVKDEKRATIPGEDFARALLAVWLGDDPVDDGLKQGMLGRED